MSKKSSHEICFKDVPNDWDSALPVGNARTGAMVFRVDNVLHIAMNNYDCYYHVLSKRHSYLDHNRSAETYEKLCRRAEAVRKQEGAERSHYVRTLHPVQGVDRPSYRGSSYPMGGELLLTLDESVYLHNSRLRLRIEDAVILFEAGRGDAVVTAKLCAAREKDGVLLWLTQSREGLWREGRLIIPSEIGMEPYHIKYTAGAGKLCMRTVYSKGQESKDPVFTQELAICLKEKGSKEGNSKSGCIGFSSRSIRAALSLLPGTGRAEELAEELVNEADEAVLLHQKYWQQFWSATVSLPDKMLEKLWYLQLYLMECSCGRGGIYSEQACGLSGLWDIRRPNMWGSMWYWDVNIQSAFWGSGCAGHPELLKVFCDGYLSHEPEIRAYTRQVYGLEGWALDYPHTLYHCIQPWCAQFLWQYYQYCGDRDFLEQKAYPIFLEQITFFKKVSEWDEKGIRHMRYDISPEQGPVTMDSVITISCIRKLIMIAIEAGAILNKPEQEIKNMKVILKELPQYPLTEDGSRYKDSQLVQDNIFLRHPSVLMPLFPAEEIDAGSPAGERELWERTLSYASEHTEIGTFGMGWLAAAAARLGQGRTALRLIYEKGLDYILHSNGLCYEESERFLNYCHLTKPSHYLPVMMESAGGLLNAVNQMLLQTGKHGEIRVFPAVPDVSLDLLKELIQYREDDHIIEEAYESWEDVSFKGLLAPGGFRVSAKRKDSLTIFLKVESSKESVLKLMLPGELSEDHCARLLERKMKAGEVICWGEDLVQDTFKRSQKSEAFEVLCHTAARTNRRVFLGADRHTAYYQAVDSFTSAYLLANDFNYTQTPYIFDFGTGEGEKDYNDSYPRQFAITGQCALYAAGPRRIGEEEYRPELGYGFRYKEGIRALDRRKPDDLRRDLVEGTQEAVFIINLSKGKYDFLLISGDEAEDSYTRVDLPEHGTAVSTGKLGAGYFSCKILPIVHERDGELEIRIVAGEGYKWKLNAVFVNKEYRIP